MSHAAFRIIGSSDDESRDHLDFLPVKPGRHVSGNGQNCFVTEFHSEQMSKLRFHPDAPLPYKDQNRVVKLLELPAHCLRAREERAHVVVPVV